MPHPQAKALYASISRYRKVQGLDKHRQESRRFASGPDVRKKIIQKAAQRQTRTLPVKPPRRF